MKMFLLDLYTLGLERPVVVTALVVGALTIALLARANDRMHRLIEDALRSRPERP